MTRVILWDFDGVILNSLPVKDYGFRKIFEEFDENLVAKFLEYHSLNGGLSRYEKIRYFYNTILGRKIGDEKVRELADRFSSTMRMELVDRKYLINETMEFIEKEYKQYNFHIVSGSDEEELNYLCKELDIAKYFKTIEGSPNPKNDLVKNLLQRYSYDSHECILIGDSINDYEVAMANKVVFYGFNNKILQNKTNYIDSFRTFSI